MTDAYGRDDADEVLKLVINGESVNCVFISHKRCTPIVCALWNGRIDIAIALFERGADLDMKNDEGSNMLHVASRGC
jgi:ankyrin repeat protein